MKKNVLLICGLILLLATGVVHGLWTDRWSDQGDLLEAAQKLEQVPMTIGAWQGSRLEMPEDANSGLAGMMARRYVHNGSGKVVTLFLACGRAGIVCTHTPDVCYRGNGYNVEPPQRLPLPNATEQEPHEFWTARFVKERASSKIQLRIFWSWSSAYSWKIAENPRTAFAGVKVLYKLYLIHEITQPEVPLEKDPCVEFMAEALPLLKLS